MVLDRQFLMETHILHPQCFCPHPASDLQEWIDSVSLLYISKWYSDYCCDWRIKSKEFILSSVQRPSTILGLFKICMARLVPLLTQNCISYLLWRFFLHCVIIVTDKEWKKILHSRYGRYMNIYTLKSRIAKL